MVIAKDEKDDKERAAHAHDPHKVEVHGKTKDVEPDPELMKIEAYHGKVIGDLDAKKANLEAQREALGPQIEAVDKEKAAFEKKILEQKAALAEQRAREFKAEHPDKSHAEEPAPKNR